MKTPDILKIKKTLEKELDNKRFEHSIGVAYTAAALAMRYDANVDQAYLAGLLHDCAKSVSDDKKIALCEKNHLKITETEYKNPSLLHAKAGSVLAAKEFHISDNDILSAIEYHTTGKPCMNTLEKIIFIADYIEPGRKQAPNLDIIRNLSFVDLDRSLLMIFEDTLNYLKSSNKEIDNTTQSAYEYYYQKARKDDNHE